MKNQSTSFSKTGYGPVTIKVSFLFFILFLLSAVSFESAAQKLTDPALNFTIFVKEDVKLIGTEVEGRVAAGGNLILTNSTYQVVPKTDDGFKYGGVPIGLAIRGGVELNGSNLKIDAKNYIKIGNPSQPAALKANYVTSQFWIKNVSGAAGQIFLNVSPSELGVSESNNPIFENIFGTDPGKIDIDGAFQKFISTSKALGELTNTVVMKNMDNGGQPAISGPFMSTSGLPMKPKFILDPNKINVLNISASVWNSFTNGMFFEGFSSSPGFAVIVNILNANGEVKFFALPDFQNNKGHVIFNFPGAKSEIKFSNSSSEIDGIILAPEAHVIKQSNANLVGQVIARSFVHDGHEIHYYPLKSEWYEKAIYVEASTRCEKDAPYLDYEVFSNFNSQGMPVKIEWLAPDGTVVETLENQLQKGTLLFPGAAVDGEGKGTAWPGWKIVNGKWEQVDDLNAKLRLTGSKIRVTLNPVFLADFSYPQSTQRCFTNPPPSETSLPVRLVSFRVEEQEQHTAGLEWAIENATDFSHFEIEKSRDGLKFARLGNVPFSEGQNRYGFVDGNPGSGLNFYRLKMVDIDGSFTHSDIRSLTLKGATVSYGYPNPASEILTVFSALTQGARIFDTMGREVENVSLKAGKNEINVSNWKNGLYLIRTESKETIKVIKN